MSCLRSISLMELMHKMWTTYVTWTVSWETCSYWHVSVLFGELGTLFCHKIRVLLRQPHQWCWYRDCLRYCFGDNSNFYGTEIYWYLPTDYCLGSGRFLVILSQYPRNRYLPCPRLHNIVSTWETNHFPSSLNGSETKTFERKESVGNNHHNYPNSVPLLLSLNFGNYLEIYLISDWHRKHIALCWIHQ